MSEPNNAMFGAEYALGFAAQQIDESAKLLEKTGAFLSASQEHHAGFLEDMRHARDIVESWERYTRKIRIDERAKETTP